MSDLGIISAEVYFFPKLIYSRHWYVYYELNKIVKVDKSLSSASILTVLNNVANGQDQQNEDIYSFHA